MLRKSKKRKILPNVQLTDSFNGTRFDHVERSESIDAEKKVKLNCCATIWISC